MRRRIWLILILLGLPHVAAADTAGRVAAQAFADHEAALPRGERSAASFSPALDLQFVPPQPPPLQPSATVSPERQADPADHSRADPAAGSLSFGLELQRRRAPESRAWVDDENVPGLQDDIERLIDRSTLGVRGTYRF
jgi:hypothetical protein